MTDITVTSTSSEEVIDECNTPNTAEYDLSMHIVSLFVIMAFSFLGVLLPLLAKKVSIFKIREVPFYGAKMFGAGVILATALVHMLTPAFENLSNPCLPETFTEDYGAWPGAICLMSIAVIHFVQFMAAREVRKLQKKSGHSHSHGNKKSKKQATAGENSKSSNSDESGKEENSKEQTPETQDVTITTVSTNDTVIQVDPQDVFQLGRSKENGSKKSHSSSHGHSHSHGGSHGHSHSHGGHAKLVEPGQKQEAEFDPHNEEEEHVEAHDFIMLKEKQISTYILEAGVVSHSIIVGLTLGVAREEFDSLFVALTFHQFFEGIALSAVVLDTAFKNQKFQTMFMVIFYSLTTPIGIAIGIGIAQSFNENQAESLIAQGVLDSIAAGILLYDGLVNIVVPHFKSEKFANDPTWFQILQWGFFYSGAAIMALIGKWA